MLKRTFIKKTFSNFQCIDGISAEMRNDFGITEADYYNYLNEHNCYTVDGTDDKKDFEVNFDFNALSFYCSKMILDRPICFGWVQTTNCFGSVQIIFVRFK